MTQFKKEKETLDSDKGEETEPHNDYQEARQHALGPLRVGSVYQNNTLITASSMDDRGATGLKHLPSTGRAEQADNKTAKLNDDTMGELFGTLHKVKMTSGIDFAGYSLDLDTPSV